MGQVVSGVDVLILGGRPIVDFTDGNPITLEFSNDISAAKVGKNRNLIVSKSEQGALATLTVRVGRGSPDDRFLNSQKTEFLRDPPSYTTLEGEYTKRIGDGLGNTTDDIYILEGMHPSKEIPAISPAEADTEEATAVHVFMGLVRRSV